MSGAWLLANIACNAAALLLFFGFGGRYAIAGWAAWALGLAVLLIGGLA